MKPMKPASLLKKLFAGCAALALAAGISACKEAAPPPEPPDPNFPYKVEYSVLDANILEKPQKVVSLSPSLTEIVYEMGLESRLAGVSDYCAHSDIAQRLTACGTAQNPDLAAIKAISPQVVLTSALLVEQDLTALQQMGIEVVALPPAQNLEELERLYQAVGCVFDGKEQGLVTAEDFYSPLLRQLEGVANAVSTLEERMNAVYLTQPYYTMATGDSFESLLLRQIGMDNLAEDYAGWTIPEEARSTLNPDIVFYAGDIDLNKLIAQPGYSSSKALANETFYDIDVLAIERQGKDMFQELLKMVELAYPDLDVTPPPEPEISPEGEGSSSQEESLEFEGGVSSKED